MPATANVVIYDNNGDPVRTFVPTDRDGTAGISRFVERTDGLLYGQPRLEIYIRPFSRTQTTRKATISLAMPKRVTSESGDVSVAYENLAKLELTVSAQSVTAERTEIRDLISRLADATLVATAIDNMEGFW